MAHLHCFFFLLLELHVAGMTGKAEVDFFSAGVFYNYSHTNCVPRMLVALRPLARQAREWDFD